MLSLNILTFKRARNQPEIGQRAGRKFLHAAQHTDRTRGGSRREKFKHNFYIKLSALSRDVAEIADVAVTYCVPPLSPSVPVSSPRQGTAG